MFHLILTAARELRDKPPELEAALAAPPDGGAQNGAVKGSRCSSSNGHGAALSRIGSLATPVASNVVLHVECDSPEATKKVIRCLRSAIFMSFFLLILQLVQKFVADDGAWFMKRRFASLNVALAASSLTALLIAFVVFVKRLWAVRHRHWTKRRRRLSFIYFVLLILQIINCTCYLIPNIALRASVCNLYGDVLNVCGFIRWTCWNSSFALLTVLAHMACPHRETGVERSKLSEYAAAWQTTGDTFAGRGRFDLDQPLYKFWLEAILWCLLEANLIWMKTILTTPPIPAGQDCTYYWKVCYSSPEGRELHIATGLIAAGIGMYFIAVVIFLLRADRGLQPLPYEAYRVGRIIFALQVRTTGLAVIAITVCTALLWTVLQERCSSYLETWPGLSPAQVIMATLVCVLALFFSPRKGDDRQPVMQVLLQQLAWGEGTLPVKRAERLELLQEHGNVNKGALQREPLFCMETCLKAFQYSVLAYRWEERRGADAAFAEAADDQGDPNELKGDVTMGTNPLDLTNIEVIRETTHDSKMLLGTSRAGDIVLAFRGTASRAGMLADLRAYSKRHPYQRPVTGLKEFIPAKVHAGFLDAWSAGGFKDVILTRVRELLEQAGDGAADVRILTTGHSLGGALATLAAYEIQVELAAQHVVCITFGAPHVGNHTFVQNYNSSVPETWHLIHDQDTITRAGKLFKWFRRRRTGQRAIVTGSGDIIVRPMPLELRMQLKLPGGNISHHYLAAYERSLLAVLHAQFTPKGLRGGAEGVIDMLRGNDELRRLLHAAGFDLQAAMQGAGYAIADGDVVMEVKEDSPTHGKAQQNCCF